MATLPKTLTGYPQCPHRRRVGSRGSPPSRLFRLFDQETEQGRDIRAVNRLLRQALVALRWLFGKRIADLPLRGRDTVLPEVTEKTEFGLITWLAVKYWQRIQRGQLPSRIRGLE